jgi:PAS domain S-box
LFQQSTIESELHLTAIFDNISESVLLLDKGGTILCFNNKTKNNVARYTNKELEVGKSVFYYFEESSKIYFKDIESKILNGKTVQIDHEFEKLPGDKICFQFLINPVYDKSIIAGICITARDITQSKNNEEKLIKSEKNYRYLFENNPLPLWIYDLETYKFLEVNKAAIWLYGYTREEFLSMSLKDVRTENNFESLENDLRDIKIRNTFSRGLWEHIKKNGESIFVEISAMPITYKNKKARVVLINDITQRKLSEYELIKSEHNYQLLINTVDGIVWEADAKTFQFSFVSKAAERLLGYPVSEWLGSNTFWKEHIHPEDREKTVAYCERCTKEKISHTIEYRMTAANGTVVFISDNISVIVENDEPMFLRGIMTDITVRKKKDEQANYSELRYRSLFEQNLAGVYQSATNGIIINCNYAFAKMLKYDSPAELLTINASELYFSSTDRHKFIENLLSQQKLYNYEEVLKCKDGSPLYVIENISLRKDIQSGKEFFDGILIDISEKKLAEIKMLRLNENLENQTNKLAISNAELERYAYVTSHDLQEPLRMVTSFLQLLQKKYDQQLDETAQKYINFAVDGAARMKTLILDLLEFSRVSSVTEDHTVINLNNIIIATRQALKTSIDASQAIINVDFLPEVCGNESQLLQLFQNLISNAIKYKGASNPIINISYTETPIEWQFCIDDNGIGIDGKFFEKIFIIFQRLHNKKEYAGTGIGLAICKKIVELHGGKIWVESDTNGSRFYFTIIKFQKSLENSKTLCPDINII